MKNMCLKNRKMRLAVSMLFPCTMLLCGCCGSKKVVTEAYSVGGVQFTMVEVKGGSFKMGPTEAQEKESHDVDYPVHKVTLSDYYIGQTEVTQALWMAVMDYNPSEFQDPQKPVENVSWYECVQFIEKLNKLTNQNFRLPTDAEWEYAARGGKNSKNYKYSGSDVLNDVAWNINNSGGQSHVVATKKPNELGIYDMSGNVWEWCDDWFYSVDDKPAKNPRGLKPSPQNIKIDRGGGWNRSPRSVTSYRGRDKASYKDPNLGFRLAK